MAHQPLSPFQRLAHALSSARAPRDLAMIGQTLGYDLLGTRAIVALGDGPAESWLPSVTLPTTLASDHIVPYFSHQTLYFIYHEQLDRVRLAVDYTISLDTNAATYVRRIVENGSLLGLDESVAQTFELILSHNYNFDAFFYCVENCKQGLSAARKAKLQGIGSPKGFWNLLNEGFRQNLVCIHLFNSVDCQHYRSTGTLRFTISFDEAVDSAIRFAYEFYASSIGQELINERLLPLHRLILLQMVGMFKVQFSSNSGPRIKLRQFLTFVQEKGGPYLARETVLALKYFKERSSVPLFEKVNRGGTQKRLMATISNIA